MFIAVWYSVNYYAAGLVNHHELIKYGYDEDFIHYHMWRPDSLDLNTTFEHEYYDRNFGYIKVKHNLYNWPSTGPKTMERLLELGLDPKEDIEIEFPFKNIMESDEYPQNSIADDPLLTNDLGEKDKHVRPSFIPYINQHYIYNQKDYPQIKIKLPILYFEGNKSHFEILKKYSPLKLNEADKNLYMLLAVNAGKNHFTNYLLDQGFKINKQLYGFDTIGHRIAASYRFRVRVDGTKRRLDTKMLKNLINRGIDLKARGNSGHTILYLVCAAGNYEIIDYAIKMNPTIASKPNLYGHLLHAASEFGYLDIVKLLLKNKADVNAFGANYDTAIHLAVRNKHHAVMKYLVEHGAKLNTLNIFGDSVLFEAVKQEDQKMINYLKDNGAYSDQTKFLISVGFATLATKHVGYIRMMKRNKINLKLRTPHGQTLLHFVQDPDTCQYLIDQGINVNIKSNPQGFTALHEAVVDNRSQVTKVLIDNQVDLNAVTSQGDTALHLTNDTAILSYLIKKGADINILNNKNKSPLSLALENKNYEVCNILLDAGARLNVNTTDMEILTYIVEYDNLAIKKKILNKFLDVENKQETLTGIAAYACLNNDFWLFNFALNEGLNINASYRGEPLLHITYESEDEADTSQRLNTLDVNYLLSKGADINVKDKFHLSLLHKSIISNEKSLQLKLLKMGAKVNITNKNGWTPLHLAAFKGDILDCKLLLKYGADPNLETREKQRPDHIAKDKFKKKYLNLVKSKLKRKVLK